MKKALALLTVLAVGGMSAPTYAESSFSSYFKKWSCNIFDCGSSHSLQKKLDHKPRPPHHHHHEHAPKPPKPPKPGNPPGPVPEPSVVAAPEIDAGQAGLALALLGSICAISRERRLRKS